MALVAEGSDGDDALYGGELTSYLDGGAGNDVLWGGHGADDLVGGEGDDYLVGNAGVDAFDGGPGQDDLRADESPPLADAAISCGAGDDTLIEDDVDDLPDDCELSEPPYLDGEPQITGDARVGGVLMVSPPRNIGGNGVATIQWERCDASGKGARSSPTPTARPTAPPAPASASACACGTASRTRWGRTGRNPSRRRSSLRRYPCRPRRGRHARRRRGRHDRCPRRTS